MVGIYKWQTDRQNWSVESMNRAIQAVNSGEMGWLKASKIYGVPQATLRRRAQNKNKQIKGTDKGLGRYLTTFSLEQERELVEYLLHLETATDIAQEQEQDPVDDVINLQEVLISKPSTSKGDDEITRQDVSNPSTVKSSSSWVRPEEVSPIPRIENTKRKRQTTGSQALTESPILAEIKTRAETKRAAELRRAANRAKKNIQSQLNEDEDEEKGNNIYIEDDDEEDAACIFCNDLYSRSKSRGTWIRCRICTKWAHAKCAGVDKKIKNHTCDLCQ
ncbi:hypothetical protein JTB14_017939 [Gonioctena quinquepunctata]|nr:hypothetical protein JTB14_017939 [Gonioctena quinquepunctata]